MGTCEWRSVGNAGSVERLGWRGSTLVFFHELERADNAPSVVALRGWKLGAAGLFVDVFEELAYVEGIGDESGEEMDEPGDQRGKRDVQIRELRVEGSCSVG
jgi:hypothetical protein